MKNVLFLLSFLLFAPSMAVLAQQASSRQAVFAGGGLSNVGSMGALGYERYVAPRHVVYAGLRWNSGRSISDETYYQFKPRFRQDSRAQKAGLYAGYEYRIPVTSKSEIGIGYNLQLSRLPLRYNSTVYYLDSSIFRVFPRVTPQITAPIFNIENVATISLTTELAKRLYLVERVGVGATPSLEKGKPAFTTMQPNWGYSPFMVTLMFGLSYGF